MPSKKSSQRGIPLSERRSPQMLDWRAAQRPGNRLSQRPGNRPGPTGTIAFLMDCDTTGIEPDIALVKYKLLAGAAC